MRYKLSCHPTTYFLLYYFFDILGKEFIKINIQDVRTIKNCLLHVEM